VPASDSVDRSSFREASTLPLYRLRDQAPQIPASAYVAAEATLIGRISLGERASVWSGAVARGDNEPITIGDESNVQEGAVLHADPGFPLVIGNRVTVGHQAMVHGCTIGDGSLIGIQAVVMNGAVIGRECLVGAGAIVTERKTFPDRSLILGAPAKLVRALTDAELAGLRSAADGYVSRTTLFRDELERVG
jgi:carbonic anhydrase/acetyltransferase-like protein (isoleucine patch superfamily)